MYQIEMKSYGYKVTLAGKLSVDEMSDWIEDSRRALENSPETYGVLVDLSGLELLDVDSKQALVNGQKLYQKEGMQRSAVAVPNSSIALQTKRISKQTGIYEFERYLDASSTKNWEQIGVNWIENGIDPDA